MKVNDTFVLIIAGPELSLAKHLQPHRGAQELTGENLEVVWAEFSTLEVAICMLHNFLLLSLKLPNLKLKAWPKQLLGSLLLVIAHPGNTRKHTYLGFFW